MFLGELVRRLKIAASLTSAAEGSEMSIKVGMTTREIPICRKSADYCAHFGCLMGTSPVRRRGFCFSPSEVVIRAAGADHGQEEAPSVFRRRLDCTALEA
jgi:hypothetical protein